MATLKDLNIAVPQPATAMLQGKQFQNQLRQLGQEDRRIGIAEERLSLEKEMRQSQKEAQALSMAFQYGQTAEQQQKILDQYLPGSKIKMVGQNVTYTAPDGSTYIGPQGPLSELAAAIAQNPEWSVRPETAAWAAARGISTTPPPESKGFTLSPGEVRFGPGGKVIAKVDKPKEDDKNLTEMQLMQRAVRGDKEAQEILDRMQERKIGLKQAATFKELEESKEKAEIRKNVPILEEMASKNPMSVYREKYRMNDDGTLYKSFDTGLPEKLPDFDKKLGKRGMVTAILQAGEHWDDAKELKTLLDAPSVAKDLRAAEQEDLWDRVKGRWSNRINQWMAKNGISKNSKTATAIRRMQKMASDERKRFLGSAVTATELESVLAWMPDAGDSYDAMINKINLIAVEGQQTFKRFLDVYKNEADMSPFYDAFGIDRFETKTEEVADVEVIQELTDDQKALYEKYPFLKE